MLDLIERLLKGPTGGVSDETLYTEHCAEFRALNALFWQIPVLVTTLSGGLWFAVASLDLTDDGQAAILWFSAAVNVAFFVALWRLRAIMEGLLKRIRRFEGRPEGAKSYIVLTVFFLLMGLASVGAIIVALEPSRYLEGDLSVQGVVLCTQAPGVEPSCRMLKPS